MKNKKYVVFTLLICAVVICVAATSFAFFTYNRTGVVNTINLGSIEFAMLDGDSVTLTNAFPQSDEKGVLNDPYNFTVKNTSTGSTALGYTLSLVTNNNDLSKNYFTNEQIKFALVKDGVYVADTSATSGKKVSEVITTGTEGVALENQIISAGQTHNYNLIIWIDNEVNYSSNMDSNGLTIGNFNSYEYSLKVKIDTSNTIGPVSFSTDSWETIQKAVKANNTSLYNVGDEKVIDMGKFGQKTVRLANKTACTTEISHTACGFVIEFKDIITNYHMNPGGIYGYPNGSNVGGYPASALYSYLNSTIMNAVPQEVKDIMIDTKTVSSHGKENPSNFTTTEKLYLLAPIEVWNFTDFDSAYNTSRQLDFYSQNGVTINSSAGSIKKYNGTASQWWFRSAIKSNNYGFVIVKSNGSWDLNAAASTLGVAPAFRIG